MPMSKRRHYKGFVITARATEREPTPLGHRRFSAAFMIAGASGVETCEQTPVESVFTSLGYAADNAVNAAKRQIDAAIALLATVEGALRTHDVETDGHLAEFNEPAVR